MKGFSFNCVLDLNLEGPYIWMAGFRYSDYL